MEWFYAKEGKQLGPVEFDELRRMAGAGELKPESLIWKKGMPQWTAASGVAGLFDSSVSSEVLEGAGFWIRLLARVIDMIYVGILGIVAGVFGGLLLVALAATGRLAADWQDRMAGFSVVGLLTALLGAVFYHTLCEGLHGATVGKILCGLRVRAEDGSAPNIRGALIRTLGFYIDGLFFGLIGFAAMRCWPPRFFDRFFSGSDPLRQQRLGDRWGRTVVARVAEVPEAAEQPLKPFFIALAYGSAACAASLAIGLFIKTL